MLVVVILTSFIVVVVAEQSGRVTGYYRQFSRIKMANVLPLYKIDVVIAHVMLCASACDNWNHHKQQFL